MRQETNFCNEIENSRPVFKSTEEYENWRREFRKAVAPSLKKHAEAHRKSVEMSRSHICR